MRPPFLNKRITQDMAYKQSLMKYAANYGVSCVSRKYNRSRSYLYFWKAPMGWQCRIPDLPVPASPQPPQSTHRSGVEADPGYAPPKSQPWLDRTVASSETARVSPPSGEPVPCDAQAGDISGRKKEKADIPKPYEQMPYPGQRIQVDGKAAPRRYMTDSELRPFQYTAMDEFFRLRFLAACPERPTCSSADF